MHVIVKHVKTVSNGEYVLCTFFAMAMMQRLSLHSLCIHCRVQFRYVQLFKNGKLIATAAVNSANDRVLFWKCALWPPKLCNFSKLPNSSIRQCRYQRRNHTHTPTNIHICLSHQTTHTFWKLLVGDEILSMHCVQCNLQNHLSIVTNIPQLIHYFHFSPYHLHNCFA